MLMLNFHPRLKEAYNLLHKLLFIHTELRALCK